MRVLRVREEANAGTLLIRRQGSKKLAGAERRSEVIFLNRLLCLLKVLRQEKRLNYKNPLSVFFTDVRLLKGLVNLAFHSEYATNLARLTPKTT